MHRATRVFRALRGVTFQERLSSGPTAVIHTLWRLEAPDKLAYTISGGAQGIQVGARRWDRADDGATWTPSQSTRLPQPSPQWESVTNARILGRTTVRGRPAVDVAFFDAQIPAWFRVKLDPKTAWTLDMQMTAPAHFMHDQYRGFNTPAQIAPPPSS
jgi:hypothetical protein